MVRAIRRHRQNMKTDITDDSKVSRLSVAIELFYFFLRNEKNSLRLSRM